VTRRAGVRIHHVNEDANATALALTQVLDLLYDADLDRIRGLTDPRDFSIKLDLLTDRWDRLKEPFATWSRTLSDPDGGDADRLADRIAAWLASPREVIVADTPNDPAYSRLNSDHALLTVEAQTLASQPV